MTGGALDDAVVSAIERSFAAQGFLASFGARISRLERGLCVLEAPIGPRTTQQHGFVHGGVSGTLGDSAGGYAAMSVAPAGSEVLTVSYTINFLRPASGERLYATGRVLRAGRSLSVTAVDVEIERDGRRSTVSVLQQTLAVVAGEGLNPRR